MFKACVALAASLICMTGDATLMKAQAYEIACGETSSVFETAHGALQLHKGGNYTFWDQNGNKTPSRGYWRYANNGDVRVFTPDGSYDFPGLMNADCDRYF